MVKAYKNPFNIWVYLPCGLASTQSPNVRAVEDIKCVTPGGQYCVHHVVYPYHRENCALLHYYAPSSGNFLLILRDNLSVPSSGVKPPPKRVLHTVPSIASPFQYPLNSLRSSRSCLRLLRRLPILSA